MTICVSFTGIYGEMRRRGKQQLKSLGVAYSGSLLVNETTLLITDPSSLSTLLAPGAPSDKLRLAVDHDIPVVSHQWLEDSAIAGKLLSIDDDSPYILNMTIAMPALTEASGTFSDHDNMCSPVEKLREALSHHTAPENRPFVDFPAVGAAQNEDAVAALSPPPHIQQHQSESLVEELASPAGSDMDIASPDGSFSFGGAVPATENENDCLPAVLAEDGDHFDADLMPSFNDTAGAEKGADAFSNQEKGQSGARARSQRSSLSRMALTAHHLPLSITVPGEPLPSHTPTPKLLAAIKKKHGTSRAPTFYSSIEVLIGKNRVDKVTFVAGDYSHGAKIVYDTDPRTNRQIFAHVIVKSIYTLKRRPAELWMEHHYLFTSDDVEERPAWKAALQNEQPMADEELLISVNAYHSPCNLIIGDFGVQMAGKGGEEQQQKQRQRLRRRGRQERSEKEEKDGGSGGEVRQHQQSDALQYMPVMMCRRAFDAAVKTVLPLIEATGGRVF